MAGHVDALPLRGPGGVSGRDAEIAELLRARVPQEQRVAALWWPGTA